MHRPSFLLLVVFVFAALLHFSLGAEYFLYVDPVAGQDAPACIIDPNGNTESIRPNASTPCHTIRYALSPLTSADQLREFTLLPGEYKGRDNTNISLLVTSAYWVGSLQNGVRPIINCEFSTYALTIQAATTNIDHEFENIEFRNCVGTTGGAINILQRVQSTTFRNCLFQNNHATQSGGAIQGSGALGTVTASVAINSCTFRNNSAATRGGAISIVRQSLSLQSNLFVSNYADVAGAVYGNELGNDGTRFNFLNNNFTNNLAATTSGAFFAESVGARTYSFLGTTIDNNCAVAPYSDAKAVQVRCASSSATCTFENGTFTGCSGVYVPPAGSDSGDEGGVSNRDRAIIIGVVVPFAIIAIIAVALFLYMRKKHNAEMNKRDDYRKKILKALEHMPPEEQEAARQEAERADPKAPKCQLCQERPIVHPLPCGHEIVCSVCRTILLECPIKGCKAPTR